MRVVAGLAAFGSLLGVLLGVSRTGLAMARDRHLPPPLAAVHPRHQVPHRAEVAAATVVILLVLLGIAASYVPGVPTLDNPAPRARTRAT